MRWEIIQQYSVRVLGFSFHIINNFWIGGVFIFDFEKLPLKDRIRYFIDQKKETEYWDFKQKWSGREKLLQKEREKYADELDSPETSKEEKERLEKKIESEVKKEANEEFQELIKDIICFSNVAHYRDCYLIFGVTDDFEIVGIEESNRLEQSRIEDVFSSMSFANSVRPEIDIDSIVLDEKEIQVLTIYNTELTPIYLEEPYGKMMQGCIYSRHGDKNTPNNGNSTPAEIEKLWRKRFKLLKPSLEFVFENLNNQDEWKETDGNFYNSFRPAYNIQIEDDDDRRGPEFYHFSVSNPKYSYENLYINYNNTKLDSYLLTWLDSARLRIPVPEWGFVREIYPKSIQSKYRYYLEDSNRYKLFQFLYDSTNPDERDAMQRLTEVIVFYRSDNERKAYEYWINIDPNRIKESVEQNKEEFYVDSDNPREVEIDLHQLALGQTLNQYLKEFRNQANYIDMVEDAIYLP